MGFGSRWEPPDANVGTMVKLGSGTNDSSAVVDIDTYANNVTNYKVNLILADERDGF